MSEHHGNTGTTAGRVIDPVCGMQIDSASASGSAEYRGQRFFFCSASCQAKFASDPARYAVAATSGGAALG